MQGKRNKYDSLLDIPIEKILIKANNFNFPITHAAMYVKYIPIDTPHKTMHNNKKEKNT